MCGCSQKEDESRWFLLSLKKTFILFLFFSLTYLTISQAVYAHCPLCSAATGVAIGVARWYGVDDLIIGVFAGGFIMATSFWLNNILLKRHKGKEYIPYQLVIIILFTFLSTVFTFSLAGFTNTIYTLFGIDRIILGFTVGSLLAIFSFKLHDLIREGNAHQNFIPFQVIIITLALLSLTSSVFYLLGWV